MDVKLDKNEMIVHAEWKASRPIKGVDYSNAGVSLGTDFVVKRTADLKEVKEELKKQFKVIVDDYADNLAEELGKWDKIIMEKKIKDLREQYEGKITKCKGYIKELLEEINKLKGKRNEKVSQAKQKK